MKFEFERQMKIYTDLLESAEKYEQSFRWEQAFNIYLNAEKIVKKYGSKTEIGNIYYRKGRVLGQKGNLKESINSYKESLKFLKKGGAMPLQIATVIGEIGNSYKINGYIEDAIEKYQESLKLLEAEKERVLYTHSHLTIQILEAIARQLNNIGEMNLVLGNWDKALENCRNSLNAAIDTKTPSTILKARLAIAKIYSQKGDFKSALDFLMQSLDIAKQERDEFALQKMFLEIANIYNHEKEGKNAQNFYSKALKLAVKLGNKQQEIEILDKIGTVYLKNNNKNKALQSFEKAYQIGSEMDGYYFDHLLYHLGLLDHLNKNYDTAYDKLKSSLKFAKKAHNKQLLISIYLKIGDLLKGKNNFEDSIYYYKKGLGHIRNLEREIKILNKIGLSYFLAGSIQEAQEYLLRSFNWLRTLYLNESNNDKKAQLITNYSEIPLNLCGVMCASYEETKDIELLKKAVGYPEFFRNRKDILYQNQISPSNHQKIRNQIQKQCLELKKLNIQYQQEKNVKEKEKLLLKINESQNILFLLEDSLWETSYGAKDSFPQPVEKIVEKLFQAYRDISDSLVISDFIFVQSLKTLFIFLIDLTKNEITLFTKKLDDKLINTVQKNLKKLEDPTIKDIPTQHHKILTSLNNNWIKLAPPSFLNFLIKQKYKTLIIVPANFLTELPWLSLKIKQQPLSQLAQIQIKMSVSQIILEKAA